MFVNNASNAFMCRCKGVHVLLRRFCVGCRVALEYTVYVLVVTLTGRTDPVM